MTRKITLVAVVAMLAMSTSAALALGGAPSATTDDAAMAQETTTTAPAQNETANVTFENQTSNGSAVVVQEVVVPEGGFVVIHEANATDDAEMETETTAMDGEMEEAMQMEYAPGAVLGNSTYLEPGTHENVTVELDETLEESQVLIAMPHQDTNDNQQYDFPEADAPYTADGEAVTDWANVTVEEDTDETTTVE